MVVNSTRRIPSYSFRRIREGWKDAVVGFALYSMLRMSGIAVLTITGLLVLILTPLFGWLCRVHQRRKPVSMQG
jgi:hypothetical protein